MQLGYLDLSTISPLWCLRLLAPAETLLNLSDCIKNFLRLLAAYFEVTLIAKMTVIIVTIVIFKCFPSLPGDKGERAEQGK